MTLPTRSVLHELLADPARAMYGRQICTALGLPGGTVYPILARLAAHGWVCSHWEEIDPIEHDRPRRRYYQVAPSSSALSNQAALNRASPSFRARARVVS